MSSKSSRSISSFTLISLKMMACVIALSSSPMIQTANATTSYSGESAKRGTIALKGNASKDATLEFDGRCYVAHNNSATRKIKFGVGNFTAIVGPRQLHTFVDLSGRCFTSFSPGGPWADYA